MLYQLMHYRTSVKIMDRLKIFLIVVVALVSKDGALSCSLQSHKSLCSSTKTNKISIPQYSSVPKPLNTSPLHCGSSTSSISCSPNAVTNPSNDLTSSSEPNPSSGTSLPITASSVTPKLTESSSHSKILLNLITKLLSNSEGIQPSISQITPKPTSNSDQVPVLATKPCTIPRICNSLSSSDPASSSSSNALPRQPCVLGSPSTVTQVPSLPISKPVPSIPPTNSFQTSSVYSDLLNFFFQLLTNIFGTKHSSASKIKPLSQPCPIFKPALYNGVEIFTPSKPVTTAFNCTPSFDSSSSSNGMPLKTNSSPKITIPEPAPEEFPAQIQISNPTSPQAPASTLVPVSAPASTISIVSGHNNSAILNLLIKCLLSTRASTGEPVSLTSNSSSPCSLFTSTINKTRVTPLKPQSTPATCATAFGSNSCSSSVLPSSSSISILSPNLTSESLSSSAPSTSASGIPYGYNPNFIKLLIKHLLSTHPKPLPAPLDTSFPIFDTKLNTTSIFPSKPNTFLTSTTKGPLLELSNNLLGELLNKSYDLSSKSTPSSTPVPIKNPSISTSDNSALTNSLCKVLSPPSISLKKPPCLPQLSLNPPIPTLNISVLSFNPTPLTTSVLLNKSYDLSLKSTPSITPVPITNPNISSSDNPALTNLLCKNISPSLIPSKKLPCLQLLNLHHPISNLNNPVLSLNPTPLTMNALLNKSYDLSPKSTTSITPVPITNPNISTSDNSVLPNPLCKIVSPPLIPLKTPHCLPPLSLYPSLPTNIPINSKPLPTSTLCTSPLPPVDTVPDTVLNTPSPTVLKPFPEPNQNLNVDIVLKPTLKPHLCHLKHSRLIHPTSTSSDAIPHIKHISRPLMPSSPLPCSKTSRLVSGCKHFSLV